MHDAASICSFRSMSSQFFWFSSFHLIRYFAFDFKRPILPKHKPQLFKPFSWKPLLSTEMISAAWSHTQLRCSHFIESLHWSSTYCVNTIVLHWTPMDSIVTHSNPFVFNKLLNWVLPERIFLNASEYILPEWIFLNVHLRHMISGTEWKSFQTANRNWINKVIRQPGRQCVGVHMHLMHSYAFQCIPVYLNAFQCISIYSNVFQFWISYGGLVNHRRCGSGQYDALLRL